MSRKKHRSGRDEGIDYWQSSNDLMTGLILILLLVITLLTFYIMQVPQEDYDGYRRFKSGGSDGGGEESSIQITITPTITITITPSITPTPIPDITFMPGYGAGAGAGGGGGGGGGGTGGGEGEGEDGGNYAYEYQGIYPEEGKGNKAAIYVEVLDEETERLVRQEGIIFELLNSAGIPVTLQTYYPEKLSYDHYTTEANGTFYLPEKIPLGTYTFQQRTEVPGYDLADPVTFTVDLDYDWPEPYAVTVYVHPSRNAVTINQTDDRNNRGVPGGAYEIVADGEVRTLDGTLRYADGQVATTVEIGDDGKGESEEIFLGKYFLRQSEIPLYYASVTEEIPLEVTKKGDSNLGVRVEVLCEKSLLTVSLTDELQNTAIPAATFEVIHEDHREVYTTGRDGTFTIDTLEKAQTYFINQLTTTGDYRVAEDGLVVDVSTAGRMSGQSAQTVSITNRMLRVNLQAVDLFFGTPLSDTQIFLFTGAGDTVTSWTSSASPRTFTNLSEGAYYLLVGGNEGHRYAFEVENKKEVQSHVARVFSSTDRMVITVVAVIGTILLVFGLKILQWIKRRRRAEDEGEGMD